MTDAEHFTTDDESATLQDLGIRLKAARLRKGLTAQEAELESGVKFATIGRYERGKSEPSASRLAALACAYSVTMDSLMGLDDDPLADEVGSAVADLDVLDAIHAAKTEKDIDQLVLWNPPPIVAVISIPARRRVVSTQEAQGIGSLIYERIKVVAPRTHARWAKLHQHGVQE